MRHCLAAFVLAAITSTGSAQIQGVCVSGCNIPDPPQQPPQEQDPQLDPRLILTGFTATLRGDVTYVYPNGERVSAQAGTAVVYGTKVITGPDSKAQFLLLDETLFTVGPNSEMVLDDFVYDPRTDVKRVSAKVLKGTFRFISGKVAPKNPENLKVRLNVGIIGIRGTDFEGLVGVDGSGEVVLHHGELFFEEYDTGRTWTIRPGQKLVFENFEIVGVQ